MRMRVWGRVGVRGVGRMCPRIVRHGLSVLLSPELRCVSFSLHAQTPRLIFVQSRSHRIQRAQMSVERARSMSEHLSTLRKYVADLWAGLARALGDLREPRRSNGLTSVWTVFSSSLRWSICVIVTIRTGSAGTTFVVWGLCACSDKFERAGRR